MQSFCCFIAFNKFIGQRPNSLVFQPFLFLNTYEFVVSQVEYSSTSPLCWFYELVEVDVALVPERDEM